MWIPQGTSRSRFQFVFAACVYCGLGSAQFTSTLFNDFNYNETFHADQLGLELKPGQLLLTFNQVVKKFDTNRSGSQFKMFIKIY